MKRIIPNLVTHEIYDVITGQTIQFYDGLLMQKCQELNIDYTKLSHLKSGKHSSFGHRYILPQNRDKLFILVDYNTGKEYECCTNKTIFTHLNIPYTEAQGKYIYELKIQRQMVASIGDHLIYLKGNRDKITFNSKHKNSHQDILERREKSKRYNKLRRNLWRRVVDSLKRQLLTKQNNTLNLIGCDLKSFYDYLASQFVDGMSWDNYGQGPNRWNIDHIIPCAAFNLLSKEGQQKAFHYTNCRPIWSIQNSSKNNSITDQAIILIQNDPTYLLHINEPYKTQINNRLNLLNLNCGKPVLDFQI